MLGPGAGGLADDLAVLHHHQGWDGHDPELTGQLKLLIDEEFELARQFGIMSVPTLVVMKDGKVVRQSAGARPKHQILELLN